MKALIVIVFLVLLSCTSYNYRLLPNDETWISEDRGNVIPLVKGNSLWMSAQPFIDQNGAFIKVSVKNVSTETIRIKDTDFQIFHSDVPYGNWEAIKVRDSGEYAAMMGFQDSFTQVMTALMIFSGRFILPANSQSETASRVLFFSKTLASWEEYTGALVVDYSSSWLKRYLKVSLSILQDRLEITWFK